MMRSEPQPISQASVEADAQDTTLSLARSSAWLDAQTSTPSAKLTGSEGGGTTFTAEIDLIESMGSELYVYLSLDAEAMDSEHLQELAQDAGADEVPGAGQGQVVARLAAESKVKRGEEAELYVDTSKLRLFDPESGDSLAAK